MTRCAHCRRDELTVAACGHGPLCAVCSAAMDALGEESDNSPSKIPVAQQES